MYLFRILTSMAGWCKSILSAEQKKSDFRPEEHELGLVQRTVVSWSSSQNNVINAASEPSNGLITICDLMSSLVDVFRRGRWLVRNRKRSFALSILLFAWFLLLEYLETATQSTRQARENLWPLAKAKGWKAYWILPALSTRWVACARRHWAYTGNYHICPCFL